MNADTVVPILLILGGLGLSVGILVARDRYRAWRARKSPEERAAEQQEGLRRLRNPEWLEIERTMGRPVPAVLKELYNDPAWVSGEEYRLISPFDEVETIEEHARIALAPVSSESLARLDSIDVEVLQFATDEFGNPYGVQLFELPDGDGAVYLHMLDGDHVFRIADSLADLRRWPRQRIEVSTGTAPR